MATKKYLSLDRLTEYDALIKAEIAVGDDSTLVSAKTYTDEAVANKADSVHTHDEYYTEAEIDEKLSEVNTSISNITNGTTEVKEAEHAASADSATSAGSAEKATQDASGNVITTTYETKSDATAKLESAKSYTDQQIAAIPTPDVSGQINTHNTDTSAHNDIRTAIDTLESEIDGKLSGKSDTGHTHDDRYYTEAEIDTLLNGKSDASHNHDSAYDAKGTANSAVSTHNVSTDSHNDIRVLISDLSTKVNNFLDVDDTTTDELSEVLALINANKGTLESLTTSKVNVSDIIDNLTTASANKVLSANQGVAIKALIDALQEELDTHGHTIADVSGLQSALDGKAASSHGTHVEYSTTAPVMDGTASAGSAATVARSDHKHPIDTSRASKADFDSHTGNKSNPHGVTAAQISAVPTSRTVNGKDLSANISLTASDVGAAPSSHNHDDKYYTESEIDSKFGAGNVLATAVVS